MRAVETRYRLDHIMVFLDYLLTTRNLQQKAAQAALNQVNMRPPSHHRESSADKTSPQFKEDPDAWLMVDDILSKATYPQTKCTPSISFIAP